MVELWSSLVPVRAQQWPKPLEYTCPWPCSSCHIDPILVRVPVCIGGVFESLLTRVRVVLVSWASDDLVAAEKWSNSELFRVHFHGHDRVEITDVSLAVYGATALLAM